MRWGVARPLNGTFSRHRPAGSLQSRKDPKDPPKGCGISAWPGRGDPARLLQEHAYRHPWAKLGGNCGRVHRGVRSCPGPHPCLLGAARASLGRARRAAYVGRVAPRKTPTEALKDSKSAIWGVRSGGIASRLPQTRKLRPECA